MCPYECFFTAVYRVNHDVTMTELQELFFDLVHIDSPSGQETDLSTFVANYLKNLGLVPHIDAQGMIHCSLGASPEVVFCAHLDTVQPGVGIKPQLDGHYITSDGTTILGADNKVSVAVILHAVKTLLAKYRELPIELLFTVREETNSGIKDFDRTRLTAKRGFVFDCGGGELGCVVANSPVLDDFTITIRGVSAHASRPEESLNPLLGLNHLLSNMPLGRIDEFTTLNIGLITGGSATNTSPSSLTIQGDLRSTRQANYAQFKSKILSVIDSVHSLGYEVEVDFQSYSQGYELDLKNDYFFDKIKEVYAAKGVKLAPISTTSGSDADWLNNSGITTYCLGDGAEKVHTTSERVKVSNLQLLGDIVQDLMMVRA